MTLNSKAKSIVAIAGIIGVGLFSTACSNDSGNSNGEERVLRLSHFMESTHPIEQCGFTALNKSLEGSGLRVQTFPSAQLGGEAESLEQIVSGSLDMAIDGPAFLSVYYDKFGVLDAGYLFKDAKEFNEKMDSAAVEGLYDDFYTNTGIKLFPAWYYGTRHLTSNVEIDGPNDVTGLKIRTPDAPIYKNTLAAMGGHATPIALDELYLALQQGTVDAEENPIPTIDSMKLYEVQDYINLTSHMVQGISISVNGAVWESLTSEQQVALEKAIDAGRKASYDCVTKAEQETLELWKSDGTITVNDDVDVETFADLVSKKVAKGQPWEALYSEISGK